MDWNHTEVIALAKEGCTRCSGSGLKKQAVCPCVSREVFRICYRKFRFCAQAGPYISTARLERIPGAVNGPASFGRKNEEYMADFCTVAKRTLTDPLEYNIFRFHFLLGADWKLCCRRLKMDRGTFFHAVYRVQEKLGRVFRELQPYPLYPLDEYFGGSVRVERVQAWVTTLGKPEPLRAPLAACPPMSEVAQI